MVPEDETRVIEGKYTYFSALFFHRDSTDSLLMSPECPLFSSG